MRRTRSRAARPPRGRTTRCAAPARAHAARSCPSCSSRSGIDCSCAPSWHDPAMIDAAVIGLGRWGKSIVEASKGTRLRIIRGVSKEPAAVADFAAKHAFELGTEFEEAVADPRVRAVFLATPHSLHVRQISVVAAAGKPVWCEKPLALTLAEAERAVAAGERARVVFA